MTRYLRLLFSVAMLTYLSFSPSVGHAAPAQRVVTVDRSIPENLVPPVNAGDDLVNYHLIQDAFDAISNVDDAYTEIWIAPSDYDGIGPYEETLQLEIPRNTLGSDTRNFDLQDLQVVDNPLSGLKIIGDNRAYFPLYLQEYEHCASSSISISYTLEVRETGGVLVGQYGVLVAAFGAQPTTNTGPVTAKLSDPILGAKADPNASPQIDTDFEGGLAIIRRGTYGFATKAKNAQDAGASVSLIINNNEFGTIEMGGDDPTITIPTFSISKASGDEIVAALALDPDLEFTFVAPISFYNPAIGTNFAIVNLSHPTVGNITDYTKIIVEMTTPIPVVDPYLPRGTTPILEQPNFNDPRLNFSTVDNPTTTRFPETIDDEGDIVYGQLEQPADKIILSSCDIFQQFDNAPRRVFTIKSLEGNVIELTEAVDPNEFDLSYPGTCLAFLPNVNVIPSAEQKIKPIFRAQDSGFAMNGVWFNTNPDFSFAEISDAFDLSGCETYLSNIFVTDTVVAGGSYGISANGSGFGLFHQSFVRNLDAWWGTSSNRRLACIGWSQGFNTSGASRLEGQHITCHNQTDSAGFLVDNGGTSSMDTLTCNGNLGLLQAGSSGVTVSTFGGLTVNSGLIVSDIWGTGIAAGSVTTPWFRLERIYQDAGDVAPAGALFIADGTFQVDPILVYSDEQTPVQLIRSSSIIKDAYSPFPGFSIPNVGITTDHGGTFVSYRDLEFSGNDRDMLSVKDDQFYTPGWSETPYNIYQVRQSGKLNPDYVVQELRECNLRLTLDPAEEFQTKGVYADSDQAGKTFTLISKTPSWHYLTLTSGSFVGSKYKTLRFKPHEGASVSIKLLNDSEVQVLGSNEVEFYYD